MAIKFNCESCNREYNVSAAHAGKTAPCKDCGERMTVPREVSEGGSIIYRHQEVSRDYQPTAGGENLELVAAHITRHLGEPDSVFHEIISDMVHIDVHWVKPQPDRPFHCLVTSGMSDRPMSGPDEEDFYSELVCFLPPGWPVGVDEPDDENRHYWPIFWLKYLARFPHQYGTWLWSGHTVPNGDPATPLGDNTRMSGWLVYPSILGGEDFVELEVDEHKSICFFSIIPLYAQEMDFKLKKGTDELLALFDKNEIVAELIDVDRPDTCKKRGIWPFSR